jgi:hypothetical protein
MTETSKSYQLDKSIWTEDDFENMGWHDCFIYAFSFGDNYQFLLDIDYIFKWVEAGKKYKFWLSPCTLVFENTYDIVIDIESSSGGLHIDEIIRENPQKPKNADFIKKETEFDWIIETQQGSISFKSFGFKQYVRQTPKLLNSQSLGLTDRGGVSFSTHVA